MAIYNITCTTIEGETYLWNGSSFDLLKDADNKQLFFSGRNVDENELPAALKKARKAAGQQFPDNRKPSIGSVKIPVNDNDSEGGHCHRMTS